MTRESNAPDEGMSDGTVRGLVSVVIVGHDGRQLLAACLPSLERISYSPLSLIYVDNDSSDGTLDFVRDRYPDVTAVSSGGNLGYCGGNNVGIRLALEAGAEFVLILNPDTVVYDPSFVTNLVTHLREHPTVGKVGPRVFLREPGVVQNTVLGWPTIGDSLTSRFESRNPSSTIQHAQEVSVLNGCCVLVRAAAIRDVGLYDEEYWCYVDEVEWDWRAEKAGWKRHFVPVDSIVHHQKATGYEFTGRTNFLIKRNTALWYLNAGKPLSLLAWMTVTSLMALGRCVLAPFKGESLEKHRQFMATLFPAYVRILGRLLLGRTPASTTVG